MLAYRFLSTALCTSLLALAACDKDESLGELESETAAESETAGESTTTGESTGGETEGADTGTICTDDAMICPDGTAVGRSGPDCEFDPCPGGTDSGETEGETGGPVCAPDDEYFEPAGCPSKEGIGYVIEPGCQTACDLEAPECGDGSICMPVEINPCICDGGDCCAACAAGAALCVPVAAGDACGALVGHTFSSVDEYECGIAKDGLIYCNWSIDLAANGQYNWLYSDLGEGGEYACQDGQLFLANNSVLEISYDADSGTLTWDGIDYVAAD